MKAKIRKTNAIFFWGLQNETSKIAKKKKKRYGDSSPIVVTKGCGNLAIKNVNLAIINVLHFVVLEILTISSVLV